jgi:hypothetical protein
MHYFSSLPGNFPPSEAVLFLGHEAKKALNRSSIQIFFLTVTLFTQISHIFIGGLGGCVEWSWKGLGFWIGCGAA